MLPDIYQNRRSQLLSAVLFLAVLQIFCSVHLTRNLHVKPPAFLQVEIPASISEVDEHPLEESMLRTVADLEQILMTTEEASYEFGSVPADLKNVEDIARRKAAFMATVLPAIIAVNEEILSLRAEIKSAIESKDRKTWLAGIARLYGFDDTPSAADLLVRVDAIPVSLAMAQAAYESGWGTSRFAREGNALFGQRTWNEEDAGISPEEASGFHVRAFETVADSVRSYMHNLNSHRAYREFRKRRFQARKNGNEPSSLALAETLTRYSETGKKYVRTVKQIIVGNDLRRFDATPMSLFIAFLDEYRGLIAGS